MARVALAVAMFFALLGLLLFHTVSEANRVSMNGEQLAVVNLIDDQIERITAMADDNALWDDAVEAVYARKDPSFSWDSWGAPTAEGKNYNAVAVIDHAGRTQTAFINGKPDSTDMRAWLGAAFDKLASDATRLSHGVGGVVKTSDGLKLVGVANIVPVQRSLDRLIPREGPSRLVLIRDLDTGIIADQGEKLGLHDLSLTKQTGQAEGHLVRDPTGKTVARLYWTPTEPGLRALMGSIPLIFAVVLMHLWFTLRIGRHGLTALRALSRAAMIDSLSDLPNRRSLKAELENRLATGSQVGLALLDLDGFKTVNDSFGHSVGDQLIREISQFLRELAESDSFVARLGGDEFAILLYDWDPASRLNSMSAAILSRFAKPFHVGERIVWVGTSIGLASSVAGPVDASELLRKADIAMYAAKRAGKMRAHWFDPMLDEIKADGLMIADGLRDALEQNRFVLRYQPLFSPDGATIQAVETLLSWDHPERGLLTPDEFIAIANESGLIDRIGMWVLQQACRDAVSWEGTKLTITLAPTQLQNPEFAAHVADVLAETGFPGVRLQFALPESYLIHNSDNARRAIDEIRALGIGLVLTEFGSGFSSDGFLRHFTFDKVKLDRALVREAETDESARAIVQANVAIARALAFGVVASGIDTAGQADLMRVAGCDELQGRHFAKAMPADDITRYLSDAAPNRKKRAS